MFRVGILTISDKGSRGEREDHSVAEIKKLLPPAFRVEEYAVVPDERQDISARLVEWSDGKRLNLILTSGGTGLSPRDITPEATAAVIDRPVPGIPEAMRLASLSVTPNAMLSRALAGIRGQTLIINLPGSPKAVRENLAVVVPTLAHALNKLAGCTADCGSL